MPKFLNAQARTLHEIFKRCANVFDVGVGFIRPGPDELSPYKKYVFLFMQYPVISPN